MRPDIVALPVGGGRVVHAEELEQQVAVAQSLGVELDLQRFRMAGAPGLDLLVARVRGCAAGVADLGAEHAGDLTHQFLHAPEASSGEIGGLWGDGHGGSFRGGVRREWDEGK